MIDRRCGQNTSSHAHFPVLVSLSNASHCFFLTHTRVWLKSQLASSVELTVLKLSACLVKKTSTSSCHFTPWCSIYFLLILFDTTIDLDTSASDANWNQDATTRCSAVGRTVWSSGQHHAIHSKGKSASVERKQGECCQWKAKGMRTKGDACSFRHDESRGEKITRSSSSAIKNRRRPTI